MLINAAIVEDDDMDATMLVRMLERYGEERGIQFGITRFRDGISFIDGYNPVFGIVFMDIELPDYDGLTAAKKLREIDTHVMIIFVTNMAQFAVNGYEVQAFDFVVKPLSFGNLALKLDRAVVRLDTEENARKISIYTPDGTRIVSVSDIMYAEVIGHKVTWHTSYGDISLCGSLKKIESQLQGCGFVRINSCYIVNLKYVTYVKNGSVICGEDELTISQSRKREFLRAMSAYLEGRK